MNDFINGLPFDDALMLLYVLPSLITYLLFFLTTRGVGWRPEQDTNNDRGVSILLSVAYPLGVCLLIAAWCYNTYQWVIRDEDSGFLFKERSFWGSK